MNSLMKKTIAAMMLLACVSLAAAQGGGQGRGQGRRGGNSELSVAMRADVQKELNVTDDQKAKLTALQASNAPQPGVASGGAGGAGGGGQQVDPAEMQKRMAARREEQHKALTAILNEGQMKRLGELLLQRQGYGAVTQEAMQKTLDLNDDQKSKIKDLAAKNQEAMTAIRQKQRDQELTREEATDAQMKATKSYNEALSAILTADQNAKFKDMQGKPFTFDTGTGG